MERFRMLRVARVDRLCADAVAVEFEPEDGFDFTAGQALTLRRTVGGSEERRTYSVCAAQGGPLRIGVREIPDGLFSRWLVREVAAGDEISVAPPSGRFRLVDPTARHLCLAAGSGITPVLAIAATVLAAGGEVSLLYGNRSTGTVMFVEELADLKDRHPDRLQVVHVLSREPRDPGLFSGRLEGERLRRLLTDVVGVGRFDHVWLCGPWPMVDQTRAMLAELGVLRDRIHTELFHVDEPPPELHRITPPPSGETSEVVVVLDGRTTTTTALRDVPLLDGAQASRADLPFACKGGVCGTCRARLVEGEVDMRRNYALDEAEVAAGFVLTCQARPTSARVVVDFDS